MSRIVHIAIKVDDLEKSTKFYEDVFGIYQTKTGHARGHTSRHMTDGNIDFAIMTYDSEDEAEAKLIGKGPGIHHYGVEVENREATMKLIEENGGKIFSDREEGALKFQAPDGNYGEIVGIGRYKTKEKIPNKFVHLALKVDDVEGAAVLRERVWLQARHHREEPQAHLLPPVGRLPRFRADAIRRRGQGRVALGRRRSADPSHGDRGAGPGGLRREDQGGGRPDPVEARRRRAEVPHSGRHAVGNRQAGPLEKEGTRRS